MNLSTVIFKELHLSILNSKSGLDFTSNNGIKGGVKTLNDFLKKYELSYSKLQKYTQEEAEKAFGGFYNRRFSEKKDIDSLSDDDIREYLLISPNKTKPATMLQISPTKWLTRVNKLDNILLGDFDRKEQQVITKIEEEEVVVNKVSESADLIKCIEEDIVNQYNETIKELKESSEGKDKIFLTLEEIREYFEIKPSNIPGAGDGLFLIKELPPEKNVNGVILGPYICDEYKEKDLLKTYNVNSNQLNINSLDYLVSLGKNEENQELIGIPNKQSLELSIKKIIGPFHFLNHAPHIYFYRAKEDIAYTYKDAKRLFNRYNGYILQGDALHYIGEKKKTIITKSAKSDLKDLFSEEEVLEFVSDDKLIILEQFIEEITKKKTHHICPANTALYTITTNSGKQKPVIEILNPLKIGENYLCYGNNPFKDKAIDLPLINKIESMPVLHKPEGAFPFSAIKVVEKRSIYEIKVNEVFTHLLESKNRTSLAESLNINSKDLCDFFRESVFNFYKINPKKIPEVIRKDGEKLFTSIFKNRNGNTFEKIKNQNCIVLKDESIKTIHKAISELKDKDNPYKIAKTLNYSPGQVCKYIIKTGIFDKLKAIKLNMAEEELGDEYYMSLKDFIIKNKITVPYNDSKKPNIALDQITKNNKESNNNSSILNKRKLPKKFDDYLELEPEFKSKVTKNIKQDSFKSSKLKNNLLQGSSNVLSANSLFSLKKNVKENYSNEYIDEELNSMRLGE